MLVKSIIINMDRYANALFRFPLLFIRGAVLECILCEARTFMTLEACEKQTVVTLLLWFVQKDSEAACIVFVLSIGTLIDVRQGFYSSQQDHSVSWLNSEVLKTGVTTI